MSALGYYGNTTGPILSCSAVVYTTLTEECPVTETTVVDGSTVEITWTSTSTIVTKVQQTQTIYTTSVVTEYESTDVYETVCLNSLPPSSAAHSY